ncbi:MAG: hypothetical protein JNJ61_24035 [Anaerolineae bacterium]|nr:hypothetical protein [Anaerolineae bacterium]
MAAQFKSNVRLREEKGFGSISMKRLIFCGVGAVLIFMLLRLTPLAGLSLPALVAVFAGLLLLSGARGGLPLWQRVLLGWRGGIVLRAAKRPDGLGAQLAQALSLNPAAAHVRGERLFAASMQAVNDPGEWILFTSLDELESAGGLRLVEWEGGRDGGTAAAR